MNDPQVSELEALKSEAAQRIIVALDVDRLDQLPFDVRDLAHRVPLAKIGLQIAAEGGFPAVIKAVRQAGLQVFVDAKLDDIPNTMARAAVIYARAGASVVNVHASAGVEGMKAVVEAVRVFGTEVWAVTVLTSIDKSCRHIFGGEPAEVVVRLAHDAKEAGCHGLIASAQEARVIRTYQDLKGLTINTPGIRPDWASVGDQKRILTPWEATMAGADRLIIGRPITDPPESVGSPAEALSRIIMEVVRALEARGR